VALPGAYLHPVAIVLWHDPNWNFNYMVPITCHQFQ
jgi:hypothetical protein